MVLLASNLSARVIQAASIDPTWLVLAKRHGLILTSVNQIKRPHVGRTAAFEFVKSAQFSIELCGNVIEHRLQLYRPT